jgi:hypothetical protein
MNKISSKREQKELILRFREWASNVSSLDKKSIDSLCLESMLILTFLVKRFYNPKSNEFKPIENHSYLTFPNELLFEQGLTSLLSERLVFPVSRTSFQKLETFVERNGEVFFQLLMTNDSKELAYIDSISVIIRNFNWAINIDEPSLYAIYKGHPLNFGSNHYVQDYTQIWERLIIEDCIAFASQNCLKLAGQKLTPAYQWTELFRSLVELFTLAQLFKIIYQCSTYSLRVMQESGVSPLLFQQILLENIKRYTEKAVANDWKIVPFESRPRYSPQSSLSEVFFREILKFKGDPTTLEFSVIGMLKLLDQAALR